jgi:hypothetical protein
MTDTEKLLKDIYLFLINRGNWARRQEIIESLEAHIKELDERQAREGSTTDLICTLKETIEDYRKENFALAAGQCTEGGPWGDEGGTSYCKYIRPKPEAEPVAWIIESEMQDGSYRQWVSMDRKRHEEYHDSLAPIAPLYLHPPRPEPARKPMTDEVMMAGIKDGDSSDFISGFQHGIRAAEGFHGIGEH